MVVLPVWWPRATGPSQVLTGPSSALALLRMKFTIYLGNNDDPGVKYR